MKQAEILQALGLPTTQLFKGYANKLAAMIKLVNELEKMEGFAVSLSGIKGNIELVTSLPVLEMPENYSVRYLYFEKVKQQDNCKEIFGQFEQWDEITVSFKNGSYKFPLPAGNAIYNTFLKLAGNDVQETKNEVAIFHTIKVDSNILKTFGTAVKFISKDDLRPVMQHVCITFENEKCEVAATDAHRLYYSKKVWTNQQGKTQILVTEKAAKEIAKIKPAGMNVDIHLLADENIMIEGKIFETLKEAHFPDYPCVIPEYDKYMEFEKESFVSNVKKVIPYANKTTNQVNFHLNGNIALHSEDIDFAFECDAEMPYNSKNFEDLDIAFNGKFLLDTMATFKEKELKMYHCGGSNGQSKAAIFTNDNDSVLVMPIYLND